MRHRLVLATLFCLAVSLPQTARADFGDCAADGYLGRFPDAPGALGLTCVELFNFTYPTPGGARRMRGIQDISADWAFLPGAPEAVERGARLAAAAFAPLGDFRIDDVTLLILDDAHSTFYSAEREVMAITDGHADPAGGRAGECLITLFMLGRGGDPAELAVTVAHEIFHCLQFASLSTAQMSTVGRGGDWWVEGSAEYFAALAVPGSERFTDRGAPFDAAVAGEVALNAMGHEAVILFYWMHPTSGPSGLMAFMRAMAAMRSVLADEEWLDFAEEYSDRAISHPRGGALALNPPGGEVLSFDENETLEFPLEAFVIGLGTVEYDCGEWSNTLTPANANVAVQEEGESSWDSYPEEVDAREPPAGRYRIAALHTDSEERSLSIEAERPAPPIGDDAAGAPYDRHQGGVVVKFHGAFADDVHPARGQHAVGHALGAVNGAAGLFPQPLEGREIGVLEHVGRCRVKPGLVQFLARPAGGGPAVERRRPSPGAGPAFIQGRHVHDPQDRLSPF